MKLSNSIHFPRLFLSRLFIASVSVLTTWVGNAQESARLDLRALLLAPGGPSIKLQAMYDGKTSEPVTIGARGLSVNFTAPARQFSFVVPDEGNETGFRSLGVVSLPAQGNDFILLLEPVGQKFTVHVIAGSESRFIGGATLFFNASDTPVVAVLGSDKTLIKPRSATFASAPGRGEKPFYQATLYEPGDGKVRPFFNSRWPYRDNVRCYAYIYRNEAGRLTYQAVDERLMPVAKAE